MTKKPNIPFLDLEAQYSQIKPEIQAAINAVIDSMDFVQGKACKNFADNFLKVHGGQFAVGCSNGTSAITVALRALNIGPGDEVITVSNTFFATVEAIAEVGATPILVDNNPLTYSIDVDLIEKKIGPKTKAIIPVHLYGNPAPMKKIMSLAKHFNLSVIEDCAQAHLAKSEGIPVGTFGDAATFSFYPGKNLGAYGDAGLVISQNQPLHELITMHINHGRTKKYEHDFLAGNFRMDSIQAAILDVKLKKLPEWTSKRIELAGQFNQALKSKGFPVINVEPGSTCVYHLFITECSNRDEVMDHFKNNGIGCGVHYPIPLHLQPAMKKYNFNHKEFPNATRGALKILSLPFFPEMTSDQFNFVMEQFFKVAKL